MKISRLTVDKLGVRLYDKVSAVLAELISNSYDADATHVEVSAPMGRFLATKSRGVLQDHGHEIRVVDNGHGMTPDEMQEFYLIVGNDRRADERRGDVSRTFSRKVMGKKGVGKLAPFGICEEIEIISSGGNQVAYTGPEDAQFKGYLTSHVVLRYRDIVRDDDGEYTPDTGDLDGKLRDQQGTEIVLRKFSNRKVPDMAVLGRQIAQRFGIVSADWEVVLKDNSKAIGTPGREARVGTFDIDLMEGTQLRFVGPEGGTTSTTDASSYRALTSSGDHILDLQAGFMQDGQFYPIKGWVGYSKQSHKDDLMAGVRIYCRGKIAAQTLLFNRGSGFQGEYSVRSYLVGELWCDWLDEVEDLIQTDRRDIQWSHELGEAFQEWGIQVIRMIGSRARDPMRKKVGEVFRETANIAEAVLAAFPSKDQSELRDRATEIAELMGKSLREDEAGDSSIVEPLVQLSIDLAPHVTLQRQLRDAADAESSPSAVIGAILRTAKIAELSSFGRIAQDRVNVIERLKKLKDEPTTIEAELQEIINEAPWLIDPQWSPVTSNQTLRTLRREFERFFHERTGEQISLSDFSESNKRPDFVSIATGVRLEIVEIKRPGHSLQNEEMDRIQTYHDELTAFLGEPAHASFTAEFKDFHITLVCDSLSLSGVARGAFNGMVNESRLTHRHWRDFLLRTQKMHESFLEEAERQRRTVIASSAPER